MQQTLIITDLTRMQGDRVCVAGHREDGACVRPVFARGVLTEGWLRQGGRVAIRPFAVIAFSARGVAPASHPPHTEDCIVAARYCVCGAVKTPEEQFDWLRAADDGGVARIFGAAIRHDSGPYIVAGEGVRSLGTVCVRRLDAVQHAPNPNGRWTYRLAFADATGESYDLPVTDLAFRNYLDYLRERRQVPPGDIARRLTAIFRQNPTYLRIGLARGWERYPARCFLQITGVYSFPDYLSGRCFADFTPAATPPAAGDGFLAKLARFLGG